MLSLVSLSGVVGFFLGFPEIAYFGGVAAVTENIIEVARKRQTSTVTFWMAAFAGMVLSNLTKYSWWQGILIAFSFEGSLMLLMALKKKYSSLRDNSIEMIVGEYTRYPLGIDIFTTPFISSLGLFSLYFEIEIIAYVCLTIVVFRIVKNKIGGLVSDKHLYLAGFFSLLIWNSFSYPFIYSAMITIFFIGLIFGLVYIWGYLRLSFIYSQKPLKVLMTIELILNTLVIAFVLLGTAFLFWGVTEIAYLGGSLVVLVMLIQASEGSIESLNIIWFALFVGVGAASPEIARWWHISLIVLTVLWAIKVTWRLIFMALKRIFPARIRG